MNDTVDPFVARMIAKAEQAEGYQRGYDDGVEQERASIAKELGRLSEPERLLWARGYVRAYHLTREPCPTCTGPIRETVGMVCQTCGTDYSSGGAS